MKFRKSIIGAILAAVISVTAIAPCSVVYADTSKTASAENDIPTNFKAKKTTTTITLSWDAVEGADAYKVYMFNSVSGEYEKYKNVTKNSCKITGLSKGTKYYFKVSVLTKNGEKYKEKSTSMSNSVAITTKASDTSSKKSTTKKETIGEFSTPSSGSKKNTVLKNCGIANYNDDDGDNIYVGEVMYADIKSRISLQFNEEDKLCGWALGIPCSYTDGLYMIKLYKESFGYNYTYDDGTYTWINYKIASSAFEMISIEYNFNNGYITIIYMDSEYMD